LGMEMPRKSGWYCEFADLAGGQRGLPEVRWVVLLELISKPS